MKKNKLPRNRSSLISFIFLLLSLLPVFAGAAAPYPERIISLGPINTENVYLLGAGERLVGNTVYCVRPEEAKQKFKVGTVMEASVEKILALKPDIILATDLTPLALVTKLEKLGLRVKRFNQPSSITDSCHQFLELGELLGAEHKAREIISRVENDIERIKKATTNSNRPKVFLQIGTQPLFGSVPGSFTNDFIELAGGQNILADQTSGKTNYEKVIVKNPDTILIAIMGSETGIAGQEKRNWMQFPLIEAVKNNRIFIIDPDLACSPSPVTFVEALKIMSRFIHPEIQSWEEK